MSWKYFMQKSSEEGAVCLLALNVLGLMTWRGVGPFEHAVLTFVLGGYLSLRLLRR